LTLCLLLRRGQCEKNCTNSPLSLPAPQGAEHFHDLSEARVLAFYPVLPQNPHKLPFVTIFENRSKSHIKALRS
jgi:hypothetical protein